MQEHDSSAKDDEVARFFEGHGKFKGDVIAMNLDALDGKCIRVLYEDGDVEDSTQEELDCFLAEAGIPIGEVWFIFLKKFGKVGLYTGRVLQILNNGKRMCQFCDGERYACTLAQLENYSKTKN